MEGPREKFQMNPYTFPNSLFYEYIFAVKSILGVAYVDTVEWIKIDSHKCSADAVYIGQGRMLGHLSEIHRLVKCHMQKILSLQELHRVNFESDFIQTFPDT